MADLNTQLAQYIAGFPAMVLTPVAFAGLPAVPRQGYLAAVTDGSTATWGATLVGGGANKVLAYYNGTNWTVAGA